MSNYTCLICNVIFLGKSNWLEGGMGWVSIADDENFNDKLDLLIVIQCRRNPDHIGQVYAVLFCVMFY